MNAKQVAATILDTIIAQVEIAIAARSVEIDGSDAARALAGAVPLARRTIVSAVVEASRASLVQVTAQSLASDVARAIANNAAMALVCEVECESY